ALRRQVLRRAHIVRQRTRLKNQVHAILHRNLIPRCPASDLFGIKGRAWLAEQQLPPDERTTASALLRQLDFQDHELALIDSDLARVALGRDEVHRLMSIPGVDAIVGLAIVAAIGEATRFRSPDKLVCYFGSTPGCANPVDTRPAMGGSPRPGRGMPAACSSRRPGRRRGRPVRCVRSTSGCGHDTACRSPWWPPPANWLCCAG